MKVTAFTCIEAYKLVRTTILHFIELNRLPDLWTNQIEGKRNQLEKQSERISYRAFSVDDVIGMLIAVE